MNNYWGDKPYHSLDYELKKRFGSKIYRLALNGGTGCPNRDGSVGFGGCIFCSAGGSGDFAAPPSLSVADQIAFQKELVSRKRPAGGYIAYFQAYTGTYAPIEHLRKIFTEAIAQPDIVALSIGTRPDCLGEDVLDLLDELNQKIPVWIELGLQTVHEDTAVLIRRGYPLATFDKAVKDLRDRNIDVIVHTILGLPGEDDDRILETMKYLAGMDIQGIKLQLLHILKGTDLATLYEEKPFRVFTMESYIDLVIRCLEILPPEITIHRLTGDGPKDLLIAPLWSSRKRDVLNTLHKELRTRGTYQGRLCT